MSIKILLDGEETTLPIKNETANSTFLEVIGNKTDDAASAATASLVALLRYIIANLSTDTDVAALVGALDDATATGAVTSTDTLTAYIKQIVTELQVADANIDTILTDTAELQTDLTNGGRLDLLIDAIKAATDKIGTIANAGGTATLGALLGDFANETLVAKLTAIKEYIDTEIGTIGTSTGTTIPALLAVPTADLATNLTIGQVVGLKTDTVAGTSIVALCKQILAALVLIDDFIDIEVATIATSTTTTIPALHTVPAQDAVTNANMRDVIGNKTDVAATGAVSVTESVVAYAKQLVTEGIARDVQIASIVSQQTAGVPKTVTVNTVDGSTTAWTQAAHRLFTVTGLVKCRVIGLVTESLTGAGTLAVGVAGATGCFIEALADAGTECIAGDIISNYSTGASVAVPAVGQEWVYVSSTDIDLLIGLVNITNGQISFYCEWLPISVGATVVAAIWD